MVLSIMPQDVGQAIWELLYVYRVRILTIEQLIQLYTKLPQRWARVKGWFSRRGILQGDSDREHKSQVAHCVYKNGVTSESK
jgi:hypothetical protein